MTVAVLQRLDKVARNLTPFALSLLVVLFVMLPLYVPNYGQIAPNVAVMAVFYWSIYRPDLFPTLAAFCLGLWQDILLGAPLGVNALTLLVIQRILVAQRRFFLGKSFAVVWWAFSLVAVWASLAVWILMMGLNLTYLDPAPGLFQLLLTAAVYPFAMWLFARTQHAMLR